MSADDYEADAAWAMKEIGALRSRIAALEKERDAALADNAALLGQLRFWEKALEDVVANGGGADLGWMDDGEATAMLAVIRASHPGAALLEEHRKALVRARDEGRTQGIREALEVCREEDHAELMPCIADLLEDPSRTDP